MKYNDQSKVEDDSKVRFLKPINSTLDTYAVALDHLEKKLSFFLAQEEPIYIPYPNTDAPQDDTPEIKSQSHSEFSTFIENLLSKLNRYNERLQNIIDRFQIYIKK